jgi:formamidopyrimidine-DNA glycosylase
MWSFWQNNLILLVIDKAIEVGADSSQFPKNWIYHSREKKSNAFVDGLAPDLMWYPI